MEECISEFEIIKKHPIHPLVFICLCLPVPLSLSPLFLSLTHTYLTHRHTQSGPQMAWWCQGERGLLGSKSSSVWAPSTLHLLSSSLSLSVCHFYSSPSSAFNLASSLALPLHPTMPFFLLLRLSSFFPLICPSEVLINYSCPCLSPKPCHLSSIRQFPCFLSPLSPSSLPPPPPLCSHLLFPLLHLLLFLSTLAESSTTHDLASKAKVVRVNKKILNCSRNLKFILQHSWFVSNRLLTTRNIVLIIGKAFGKDWISLYCFR